MEVWCGMILGFDNDDATIFDRQIEFIQQARIAISMIGMLSAIPKTPLHARLARGGSARPDRHVRVRHQRHPAADQPRGAPRRLRPRPHRPVRSRDVLRTYRGPVPQAELRRRQHAVDVLA